MGGARLSARAWALASLLWFVWLVYSTQLHWLVGPEPSAITTFDAWRDLSSVYGDANRYLAMAEGAPGSPPWRYRWLIPAIVSLAPHDSHVHIWVLLSAGAFILSGYLMTLLLRRAGHGWVMAIWGGTALVLTPGIQATTTTPMLDVFSVLVAVLLLWAALERRVWGFVLALGVGVWIKEVLAGAILLWLSPQLSFMAARVWHWVVVRWRSAWGLILPQARPPHTPRD